MDPKDFSIQLAEIDSLIFDQSAPMKALRLLRALPEDSQKLLSTRLLRFSALALSGRGDRAEAALLSFADRSAGHTHLTHSLRLFLQDLGAIPVRPELAETDAFFRRFDNAASFDELPPSPIDPKDSDTLLDLVAQLHPALQPDKDWWVARLEAGLSRTVALARPLHVELVSRRLMLAAPIARAEQSRLLLGAKVESLEEITKYLDAGRNVVLLPAHAGSMTSILHTAFRSLPHPYSPVMNGFKGGSGRRAIQLASGEEDPAVIAHPEDYAVGTTEAGMALHFAQLCKKLRRGPARLVCIYPDGNAGTDFLQGELSPHKLPIGPGAAALAWFGKAAVFTIRSEWRDKDIVITLRERQGVGPTDSMDDVRARLVTDYMDHWRDLLGRDPIDLGPRGGYWPVLLGQRSDA